MNLKDYAPYYIGCPCLNTWFQANHSSYNAGWKLTGFVATEAKPYHLETDTGYNWTDSIKLILNRLEDISDDEWFKIECETSVAPDAIGWHGVRESILTMDTRNRFHWIITNEVLILLRKRNVDVDGLIKAGLAVDIKTLPK
jgi:hypothetical protein